MQNIQSMLSTAFSFHREGLLNQAESIYRQLILLAPNSYEVLTLLGTACLQQGNISEAISLFERSISINQNQPDAWLNTGNAYLELGQHNLALSCYSNVLILKPDYAQVYMNCGNIHRDCGSQEQALACYKKASELMPGYPDPYDNAGIIFWEMKKFNESLEQFQKALALSPSDPKLYNHIGRTLSDMNRFDDAISAYEKAIELNPALPDPYVGLGILHYELAQYDKSLTYYDMALIQDPANPDANFSKGTLLLLLGQFADGWPLYESRIQFKDRVKPTLIPSSLPLENSCNVDGKTIILQSEQGFGDVIHFSRYALLLKQQGASVIIETRPPLVELLSSISPDIPVIPDGKSSEIHADYHAPLMSLPKIMGTNSLDSIPSFHPYLFADEDRITKWKHQLGEKKSARIGLVWSGSATHKGDLRRSISLEILAPLLAGGHEFHCLQKEIRPLDAELIAQGLNIHRHDAHIDSFSDTAALISLMDLVISVDTSVAHLAGALGKNTWVLLPKAPDYRWLLARSDSPWYPTLRLFRQKNRHDWAAVVAEVTTTLHSHF